MRKSDKEVLVRWKTRGSFFEDGRGHPRRAGEQDIMKIRDARPLITCGMIEVIGDGDAVPTVTNLDSGS